MGTRSLDVVMIVVDCLRAESLFGDRQSSSAATAAWAAIFSDDYFDHECGEDDFN